MGVTKNDNLDNNNNHLPRGIKSKILMRSIIPQGDPHEIRNKFH